MARIELDLDAIESLNRDLRRILDQVVSIRYSVSTNANSVSSAIADRRNIRSRLSKSVGDLQDLEYRLGKLHSFINDAVDIYSGTERRLAIRASEFNNLMNQITNNLKPMTSEPSREARKAYLTELAQAGGAASEWARDELAKLGKEERKAHLTELAQAGGAAAEWAKHELADSKHDGDIFLSGTSDVGPPIQYDYYTSQEYRDDLVRELYMNMGDPLSYLIALHYSRNVLNYAPQTEQEAIKLGWTKLKPSESVYHQLGIGNENNSKYISPAGKLEAVYYSDGKIVRDINNVGTYNFASPTDDALNHMLYDVLPYYLMGNGESDTTSDGDKFWVTLKAIYLKAKGE